MPLEIEEYIDERALPLSLPLSRYWAMDDGYFFSSLNTLLSMSASEASAMAEAGRLRAKQEADTLSESSSDDKKFYALIDGVAHIEMVGPMTKRPNCMAEMFGGGGASTLKIRQSLRAAARDPEVQAIMLTIESGGGEVNGAFDLAADVAAINKIKPITAYIEDMGASAAYLVASQAGKIYANSNAIIGSIGVYQEVHDSSAAAAKSGVIVHVIKAGEHKGIGVPGTEITDAQLAIVQKNADKLHGLFLRAVSKGRDMDAKALAHVADGGVFIGADAKRAGLIDGIATAKEAHDDLKIQKRRKPIQGKQNMPLTAEEVQASLNAADEDELLLDEDTNSVIQAALPSAPVSTSTSAPVPIAPVATIAPEFVAALQASGISNVEQLQVLVANARIGDEYTAALRKQVTQMSIVAYGSVDGPIMSAGVPSANIDQLRAMSRQMQVVAQSKGLVGENGAATGRQSLAQDIAGNVQGHASDVQTESNEGKTIVAHSDVVTQTRSNFQQTGLYAL